MKATEQTIQQVERFINKIGQKFPACEDTAIVTDIHVCANPDSDEITRCVVEQWIGNTDDKFFDQITLQLRHIIKTKADDVDHLGILKPYSFVLENEEHTPIAELYLADDETVIIGGDLMEGLEKDLDDFLSDLIKE